MLLKKDEGKYQKRTKDLEATPHPERSISG